ncbi:MAG: hypothetical protein KDD50_05555 [Bdellovibrionales bacterium]|nr:hypothetical protein [Bdellovibrionales bacterium]
MLKSHKYSMLFTFNVIFIIFFSNSLFGASSRSDEIYGILEKGGSFYDKDYVFSQEVTSHFSAVFRTGYVINDKSPLGQITIGIEGSKDSYENKTPKQLTVRWFNFSEDLSTKMRADMIRLLINHLRAGFAQIDKSPVFSQDQKLTSQKNQSVQFYELSIPISDDMRRFEVSILAQSIDSAIRLIAAYKSIQTANAIWENFWIPKTNNQCLKAFILHLL